MNIVHDSPTQIDKLGIFLQNMCHVCPINQNGGIFLFATIKKY